MSINLGSGGQITYQQWKTLTPLEQSQVAATLGFDPKYVDTELSAGEQIQGGTGKPSMGGEAPSSTLPNLTTPDWTTISPESFSLVQQFLVASGYSTPQPAGAFSGGGNVDDLAFIQQAIEEYTNDEGEAPQAPPETVGSGENPTPPTPGATPGVPSSLSQLFSQISAQIQAGTVTVPADSAQIVAQMSSQNPADVNAALLQLVDISNLTPDQQTFITNELSQLSSSIASSIAAGGSASFFIRLGIPELLTIQFAKALGVTSDTAMSSDNQTLLLGVLTQLANNLSAVNLQVATGTPAPSQEYQQLTSQDPAQVTSLLTSIFNSIQLPEGTMTDTEKSAVLSALVTQFTSGGTLPTELTSSNEEVVANYLSQVIEELGTEGTITPSDAASLAQNLHLIPALAAQIATINQNQCINNLYSSDPTVIAAALENLGNIPITPTPGSKTPGSISKTPAAASQTPSTAASGSKTPGSTLSTLAAGLQTPSILAAGSQIPSAAAAGPQTPSTAPSGSQAPSIAAIGSQTSGNMPSTPSDEDVGNLTPEQVLLQSGQNLVATNYLKALVNALAFLAQIRSLINQLEGQYSQEVANAKLQNLSEQVQTALAQYQDEISQIQDNFKSQVKALQKQKLMKWLMPFITILVAIIMAIITVLASIFTGGTAGTIMGGVSAAMIAKLITVTVIIVVTIVMTVLSVVDSIQSSEGKTDLWTSAAEGLLNRFKVKNQPQWLQNLVSAIIQTVIAVFIALFTFGAGLGTSVGLIAGGVGKMAAVDIGDLVTTLTKDIGAVAVQLCMTCLIMPMLSTGLLNQAIIAILQACGSHNDKTNQILAMILSIITMIAMMLVGAGVQNSITNGVKETLTGAKTAIASFFNKIGKGLSGMVDAVGAAGKSVADFMKSPGEMLSKLLDSILESLQSSSISKEIKDTFTQLLERIKQMFKSLRDAFLLIPASFYKGGVKGGLQAIKGLAMSPGTVMILNLLTKLLQITASLYEAATDLEMSNIYNQLADLNKKVSQLESTSAFLQMMSSGALDSNTLLQDLAEDAKNRADDWTKLVNTVASFITNASQDLSQFLAKASFDVATPTTL